MCICACTVTRLPHQPTVAVSADKVKAFYMELAQQCFVPCAAVQAHMAAVAQEAFQAAEEFEEVADTSADVHQ